MQLGCLALRLARLVLIGGGRADGSVAADGSAKPTGAATASWSVLAGGEQGDEGLGCFGQVVDELATLTAYAERKQRAEVEQLLGLWLTQGRAVGISVIAAVQDPSKDVIALRQLFPVRVGLRMTEATQTAMILSTAAHQQGARCEDIPDTTPGVGYVLTEGNTAVARVRAFHVTDSDIGWLARNFAPPARRNNTGRNK